MVEYYGRGYMAWQVGTAAEVIMYAVGTTASYHGTVVTHGRREWFPWQWYYGRGYGVLVEGR
jgi:hypothetical protein